MKSRLISLALCGASLSFAQYTYDYSKSPVISDSTRWSSNGSPSYPSLGVTFSGSSPGGSLISIPAISVESGGSQNDYEVNTTLALNSGGGTYIHFLRASSGTVESGSGSYISVELVIPSSFSGSASATLNINQCTSGTVTQLGSTTITASNGMTLRSVIWGTNLWVFNNNLLVYTGTVPSGSGNPGIGGYNMPSGSGILAVALGHHDNVAPNPINANPVSTSIFPTSVSLRWQGVLDDSAGIGEFAYIVSRNGIEMGMIPQAEFGDSTVQPGTTYTYLLQAVDYHGNVNSGTSVAVTTPPAGAVDPRRTGLYSTGSYWGGGGEQIDTLSGNLNFSIPLATAQGRTAWTVPVSLVYDSQNWRNDNGVIWQLGADVGFGFGWKMLIGSVTPYYTGYWSAADHYVYTDSTGAQYRLDQNNSGVWTSSTQSVYVWLDTTVSPNKLHFRDGKFWVLGTTSSGTEADAGTLYPTIIEDTFGNQVIVTYDTGAGLPYSHPSGSQAWIVTQNTSSRIISIEDSTAHGCVDLYYMPCSPTASGSTIVNFTDVFAYDHADYTIPHLTSYVTNLETGTGFTYTTVAQEPPFGSDPSYSGSTVTLLSQASIGAGAPWSFTYDSAGAGELINATFPFGGQLSWTYDSFAYAGNRSLREVSGRSVTDPQLTTGPAWNYGISRPDAQNSVVVHSAMTLTDASGVGAKTWSFNTAGSVWQLGLVSDFKQLAAAGGTILHDDQYTWSQDPAGRPYISAHTSVTDPGTGNQQSALTTQTLDQYGNATQSVIYPYNNTTTPLYTYANTYLSASGYLSNYVFNRLSSTTLNGGSSPIVSNQYDLGSYCAYAPDGTLMCGSPASASPPSREFDSSSPVPFSAKGAQVISLTNARGAAVSLYPWGMPSQVSSDDGTYTNVSADAATNYAAPQTITVGSFNQSIGYTGWLAVAQTTGPNGDQLSVSYDNYGRPSTATSPYGAETNFTYSTSAPWTQTETGPNGVTITTLDGFGRTVSVQRGPSATSLQSEADTIYAPCACSPLGKVQQVSQPYAPGATKYWTTYAYDGLGRTLSVQQPDGASTTTYAYAGNQTTVTDPAGKWKQFTSDVEGNLITVVEPDPNNQPSGTLTTSYTYDWMKHVTQVSMPRGSTAQTRTFVYNSAGQLTSATNPENGTVTYTYNTAGKLYDKHDAKGQDTGYTYDSLGRVTMIQRYPYGRSGGEDLNARVTYTYDTNPANPDFSSYSAGRLTTAQYSIVGSTGSVDAYTEMYSYAPAGAVTAKNIQVERADYDESGSVEADYTFDTAGRLSTLSLSTGPNFSYAYDSMGRPSGLTSNQSPYTFVSSVQYDAASRMTGITYWHAGVYSGNAETRSYNVNGQLASIGTGSGTLTYSYAATANDGQITQVTDAISGETIGYQYDALKRLTSASSTPISGSTPTAWTQTYQYDGFGNLTAKVLNGSSTPITVNAATNQLSNAYYDANGNMTSGAGATLTYDEANRMNTAVTVGGSKEYFGYAPDNKEIYQSSPNLGEQWTFYGARGEKLGTFGGLFSEQLQLSVWFAGRLISDASGSVTQVIPDRLGTNRASGARFYPYGDEITSTSNDREKFATYTRDSYTGLDYADQRFYASSYGRFNTPDRKGGKRRNPGSLNRYAYVGGDPVNRNDPRGLSCIEVDGVWVDDGDGYGCDSAGNDTLDDPGFYLAAWAFLNESPADSDIDQVMACETDPACIAAMQDASQISGTSGGGPAVTKNYPETIPCDQNASGVMSAIENNFASFGNATVPVSGPLGLGGTGTVTFSPPPGPLTAGESIPINITVTNGAPLGSPGSMGAVINTSVIVESATSSSLTFETAPGHLLYPAFITFSAANMGGGSIAFGINILGNFPGWVNQQAFNWGGSAFEDAQWGQFLGNVASLCNQ